MQRIDNKHPCSAERGEAFMPRVVVERAEYTLVGADGEREPALCSELASDHGFFLKEQSVCGSEGRGQEGGREGAGSCVCSLQPLGQLFPLSL